MCGGAFLVREAGIVVKPISPRQLLAKVDEFLA